MTIEIPSHIEENDFLLAVVYTKIEKGYKNWSKELLGEFKTEDYLKQAYKEITDDVRIQYQDILEIYKINEDDIKAYLEEQKQDTIGYTNNFTHIISENEDIFKPFLSEDGQTNYTNKPNCKELLVESIKIYKTRYNDELYVKTDKIHYKHIGKRYEDIYLYYDKLYKKTQTDLQRYIPFSSFFTPNMVKTRTFESLEPNRHIILFEDCILDVSNGKERPCHVITRDNIPFTVIDGSYKIKNERCHDFVHETLTKLVDEPNILKAVLYSLINKDELIKSAIFNIQKSGKGKTKLLDPFKQIGILMTADSDTLERPLEREVLFKQRLIVNFEEIQDANIQGSKFNSLVDDSEITVPRKNQKAIDVPAYIKPAIIINGEDLPDFKGRTRGTLNRFSLMPTFTGEITPNDADFIKANGFQIGIEMLRYLMLFMMTTEKQERMEWLASCKITETQYMELRESKTRTVFKYVDDTPQATVEGIPYIISEKILEDIIIYLQEKNEITVNLFNKNETIKRFIKKEIITGLNLDNGEWDGYLNQTKRKKVHKNETSKTHALKYCLQLTKKGQKLTKEMGYNLEDLRLLTDEPK